MPKGFVDAKQVATKVVEAIQLEAEAFRLGHTKARTLQTLRSSDLGIDMISFYDHLFPGPRMLPVYLVLNAYLVLKLSQLIG